jgi:Cyclic nucleotide-binding domain
MVLGFGQAKTPASADDIASLIGRKQYAKAIEAIKTQLAGRRPDPRLRLQLGDVLALAGKGKEAVAILLPLADEFAREGFAAKAISVLKKIQKLDPTRRDVDAKLASLIRKKQDEAAPLPPSRPAEIGLEIGIEEIGFAAPAGAISVPVDSPVARTAPVPESSRRAEPEPMAEIGFEAAPSSAPAWSPPPEPVVEPAKPERFGGGFEVQSDSFQITEEAEPFTVSVDPEPAPAPPVVARAVPTRRPAAPPPAPVVDRDLILEEVEVEPEPVVEAEPLMVEPEAEAEIELEAEPALVAPEDEPPDTMTDSLFAEELLSLVEDAFKDMPLEEEALSAMAEDAGSGGGGAQIVVSPLFKDFSVDELVAVIQGLNLVAFEAGDIIITQGEPGNSLYMLTAGTVKAFVKNAQGRQQQVYEFKEGAFFGEGSMLTGKPRSATLIAATRCELLELDRPTLDSIVKNHPHVLDVMQEFARQRMTAKA